MVRHVEECCLLGFLFFGFGISFLGKSVTKNGCKGTWGVPAVLQLQIEVAEGLLLIAFVGQKAVDALNCPMDHALDHTWGCEVVAGKYR